MLIKKSIIYGFFTALGIIAYFLLMVLINQEDNLLLRVFNIVFIILGVYFFDRNVYITHKGEHEYFAGLIGGIQVVVAAVGFFCIFMAMYVWFIDPNFLAVLQTSKIWGANLSITEAAFAVFIEGHVTGVPVAFIWMQYFKRYITDSKQTISEG